MSAGHGPRVGEVPAGRGEPATDAGPPQRPGARRTGWAGPGGRVGRAGPAGWVSPVLVTAGTLVAAVLVALVALSVLGLAVRQSATGGERVDDVARVLVENRCGGDVVVTGLGSADAGRVDVSWEDAWSFRRPEHGRSVEDGRLVLRARCPTAAIGGSSTSAVRVEVPGGVPVEVRAGPGDVAVVGLLRLDDVRTGSGDVAVAAAPGAQGADGRGTTVRTGSGDVVLSGGDADLDVTTGSGDVRATDLDAARVRVRTGSGSVDLVTTAPPRSVVVRTGSGDVAVTVPDTPVGYAVTTTTGSGRALVDVTRDASSPLRMVLRTGSGDVDVVPGAASSR